MPPSRSSEAMLPLPLLGPYCMQCRHILLVGAGALQWELTAAATGAEEEERKSKKHKEKKHKEKDHKGKDHKKVRRSRPSLHKRRPVPACAGVLPVPNPRHCPKRVDRSGYYVNLGWSTHRRIRRRIPMQRRSRSSG